MSIFSGGSYCGNTKHGHPICRTTTKSFEYAYTMFLNGCANWCCDIFAVFEYLGLQLYFNNKLCVNINQCKVMLMNKQSDSWLNTVKNKPKLRFYALFKEHFYVEKYVCINLSSSERSVLAQLRLGILPLHIETGRFVNTKLEDRTCKICNSVNVEDECQRMMYQETIV